MKIGIESQRIFRNHKHGMDVVAVELINQLQAIDTSNEYVLFAKDGPDKSSISETPNFRIKLLSGVTYGDWEQVALPMALKKHQPQIIHCTANTAPMICPVPLVLTLHDVIFLQETSFGGTAYQDFGNLYRKFVVPPAIKKAAKIITVSNEEKKIISSVCKVDPSKITVIHNAVDERFGRGNGDLNAFRLHFNLPENFILHLGNTAPKKNTAALLEAYVSYCENTVGALPLVIADYPLALVRKKLAELNKDDLLKNIVLPGYVPSKQMPNLYACASVFVYPSLQESFGLPLLESMASSTPVIASDIPALREVGDDAAIFVEVGSAGKIAEALYDLLRDTTLQEDLRQKGIQRAKLFTWKKAAEKLLSVYKEFQKT